MNPRFMEGALEQNLKLVERVEFVARAKAVTPAQIALAWVLAKGEDVVPIPGTKRIGYLEENVGASAVELTPAEVTELGDFVTVGARYPERMMSFLDR
jgi:aryl-alcohol dehydrogenase-like predicted oxidoreductase